MRQVPRVSGDEIKAMAQACLAAEVVARTDGWQAYRVLKSESSFHLPTVTGSGKNAVRLFPWVHTLIANVKGNIRGVYHGVVTSTCPVIWRNFVTASIDASGNPKCLTGW